MRKSILLLSGLFVLLLSFTSCLEESASTTFTPDPEREALVGEGTMTYRGTESPIVAVYDMDETATSLGQEGTVGYASLIISNRDMQGGSSQRLTQTGDVIIINITKQGAISGTYDAGSRWSPTNEQSFFANICTGMNFATGAVDDDESMQDGETVITQNDDGTYTINFAMRTDRGNSLSGTWTGDLTPAVN